MVEQNSPIKKTTLPRGNIVGRKKINPYPYQSKEYHAWRYQQNKEKRNAARAKWASENKDKEYERVKRWVESNREVVREYSARHKKSRKLRTPPWFSKQDRKEWINLSKVRDFLSDATGYDWHIDHEIPLKGEKVSGLHVKENWRLLPASENISKNNSW